MVNEIAISVYLAHVRMVRLDSTVYDGNTDASNNHNVPLLSRLM